MNILLINQYYPPDTSATAFVAKMYAETLAAEHKVTVLAGRPSYSPLEVHPWSLHSRGYGDNFVIERVGSTTYSRKKMFGRVVNYLSFLALIIIRAMKIKTDLILCMTDPPVVGIVAAMVANLRNRPFVYVVQDLHPDMALASGMIRRGLLASMWEKLHRWVLRKAKVTIVLGEDMRQRVIAKGIQPEKVRVVRHGSILAKGPVPTEHPTTMEIRSGFPFAVVHAGNLGFYGAWDTLVESAKLLPKDKVGFIFVGDGAAKIKVQTLASSCRNVRFMPFRPADEIPCVMAAGDIHVITIKKGLEGTVVPSKLYDILASGRPILAVAPETSDITQIVRKEKCGLVADPDSPESIAQAIRSVLSNPKMLTEMSQRALDVARKYGRDGQLKRFADLVDSTIRG